MKAIPLFILITNNLYMDNTINDRIGIVLKKLNYKSKRAFAQRIGISQTSFNDILNGAEPKFSTLKKIIEAEPLINPTWLLTGKGEMLKTGSINVVGDGNLSNTGITGGDLIMSTDQEVISLTKRIKELETENNQFKNDIKEFASLNTKLAFENIKLTKMILKNKK
jgi:hypothetical protein